MVTVPPLRGRLGGGLYTFSDKQTKANVTTLFL